MNRASDQAARPWWGEFTLQEAILVGFCALLIILSKLLFRFHLNITGHSVFFMAFFMLVCRGCVPRRWTATLVGSLAGFGTVLLGFGKGGVIDILKYVVPGLGLDLFALVLPSLSVALVPALLGGVVVALGRAPGKYLINRVVGMDADIALQVVAVKTLPAIAFGVLGALLVPTVVRRLQGSGLFPHAFTGRSRR